MDTVRDLRASHKISCQAFTAYSRVDLLPSQELVQRVFCWFVVAEKSVLQVDGSVWSGDLLERGS